jgi:uncharacterized protein with HEPN domain
MPKRTDALLLMDMVEAIEKIQIYTAGYSKEMFEVDGKTVDAVIRNLEILGEAASNVSERLKELNPSINWFQLKGLRNRIAHDYVGIDYEIIWDIISIRLNDLRTDLEMILKTMQ